MSDNSYNFDLPSQHRPIIKVIGVGGGGSNAVNHMYNKGIKDVEFVVCNTDVQALTGSPVPNKLQIGIGLTEGLGAGANPEKGRAAAMESKEEIREFLSHSTKMVFITAGMGGGTGTGAAPVIAEVAKELGVLTVGIVTAPFSWEGRKKKEQAYNGIDEMKRHCDTVIVVLNDKLREIYGNLSISQAFAQADNVLTTAAKGIAEIITVPGYVNVDFEDVKTVMKDSGAAVMGSARTEGENRARRAAEEALASPLLNNRNIHGAQKILLSIISGEQAELSMDELSEITEFIQEKAGKEADDVIFGHGIDASLGNSIRVTVIATGFDDNLGEDGIPIPKRTVIDLVTNKPVNAPVSNVNGGYGMDNRDKKDNRSTEPTRKSNEQPAPEPVKPEMPNADKNFFTLGEDFEVEETSKDGESRPGKPDSGEEEHRWKPERPRPLERINRLNKLNAQPNNSEDFKEKLEVPAYVRKNVRLQDVPNASKKNVSRYNLNDDNQILGNNRFLHDNVD
jgi:cell division protein FtsZ